MTEAPRLRAPGQLRRLRTRYERDALVPPAPFPLKPVGSVPLNDTLAKVHPHAADAAKQWHDYYGSQLPLNHRRALGGTGAAAGFTLAAL
jgi:hypothetical protein